MTDGSPKLYNELAGWFHLLTHNKDYVDEAAAYRDAILAAVSPRPRTLLELGSGGGNNAFHLKRDFMCTLTDVSPGMLDLSRTINPECEHIAGDMRTLRLGRQFDAVFVHDAVAYLTTVDDLRRTMKTAYVHCKAGGVALFAPDDFRETFEPHTSHGGHDDGSRGLRYVAWDWDPDPSDTTAVTDFAYLLREDGREMRVVHDRHVFGVFARATWMRLLEEVGFEVRSASRPDDEGEEDEIFVAVKTCRK